MEEIDISADPVLSTGLETRSEWTKTSKIVELQGRIHSDVFNQEKLILNGVDLTVKLYRHKPEFCLLSADTAKAYKIYHRGRHTLCTKDRVDSFCFQCHQHSSQ